MPEAPESEPTAPEAPAPAPVAPPPASRKRRLWRWTRKWTTRALLLVVSVTVLALIAYQIYRPFAYRAADKELAEVRGELDRSEPDWTYERIEADYNAKLAANQKNSYALLAKFPLPKPRQKTPKLYAEPFYFLGMWDRSNEPCANELPEVWIRDELDVFPTEIADTDPIVSELARSPDGRAPLFEGGTWDPGWNDFGHIPTIALSLEMAAAATAISGDHEATVTYARASLNAGRALGDMPRVMAQTIRNRTGVVAIKIVGRMLAWGEPEPGVSPQNTNLDSLQHDLLAESDREWLETALKGDRAVLARTFDRITADNEMSVWRALNGSPPKNSTLDWERGFIYLARPYRSACEARMLRNMTRAIDSCRLPPHERFKAFGALGSEARADLFSPTTFHWAWQRDEEHYDFLAKSDCAHRAMLRSTAVAIACERFRRANRRWPESLTEIPGTILAQVPLDPFDGHPLRYKRLDDGAVIYSIGPNLTDDGGSVLRQRNADRLDLGVRLWDPALRGLEPKAEDQPFQQPGGPVPGGPPPRAEQPPQQPGGPNPGGPP